MATASSLSTPIAYHRLMKSPLDDSEIFTSIADLMEYCDSGAWYENQRVGVFLEDTNIWFHYVIRNGYPILIADGWEPVWREFSTGMGMMIYYYNSVNNTLYVTDTNKFTYIENPNLFSILDTAGVLVDNGSYNYGYELINSSSKTSYTGTWSQSFDPMIPGSNTVTSNATVAITAMAKITANSGLIKTSCANIAVLPTTAKSTFVVKIYAINDGYYEAWGGGGING